MLLLKIATSLALVALAYAVIDREMVDIESRRLTKLFATEHERFVETGVRSPELLELYKKLQFPRDLRTKELSELSSEDSVSVNQPPYLSFFDNFLIIPLCS